MKCICSKVIEAGKSIEIPRTENPGKAKSFSIKKRHAIFYPDYSGKYPILENVTSLNFPYYSDRGEHVKYGEPSFD